MRHAFLFVCLAITLGIHLNADLARAQNNRADFQQIDKLIIQLGSKNFSEREVAFKSLDVIGQPALKALHQAEVSSNDTEIRRRAKELAESIENRLDNLLAVYREYGLPFPPERAQLVRWGSVEGGLVNGKLQPVTFSLSFILKAGTEECPPILLDGTWKLEMSYNPKVILFDPAKASVKDVDALLKDTHLDLDGGLPTAIQCYARGWNQLAQATLAESLKAKGEDQKNHLSSKRRLAIIGWNFWEKQLNESGTDWCMIAKRLKDFVSIEKTLDTDQHRHLLESLDLALIPSKAKAGSVGAKIDALVNVRSPGISLQDISLRDGEPDPRYAELGELGFAAVPELISHIDDNRLTRTRRIEGMSLPRSHHLRVGEIVIETLENLSGERFDAVWDDQRQRYCVDKAKVLAWWQKAQGQSEENYLGDHALPAKGDWLNDHIVWLIAKKYPRQLPKIYRQILERNPEITSWPLAQIVGKSSLPSEEKRGLFLQAAKNKNLHHRSAAFWELKNVDPEQFVSLLVETIHCFPKTPDKEYWHCPELGVAYLVAATDDPRAWQALLEAAKRCDVGMRMQFLSLMSADRQSERPKKRLEFLANFLEDNSIRDIQSNPKMFGGPYAGWEFDRLAVDNFAAMQMAGILKLPVKLPRGRWAESYEDWTPEQWAKFRSQVREALKRDPRAG